MPDGMLPHRRSGHGMPLVLVHGYLGGPEQWSQQIAHFSGQFDVIAPCLPGFGAEPDLPVCDRIGAMADVILALLDQLEVKQFLLLGHSMGGMIAQEMAARAKDRIKGLILYGTGPLGRLPDRFEPIEVSKQRLEDEGVAATARRIGATWFRKGEAAAGFGLVAEIGSRARREAALAGLDAMAHWDGQGALIGLTMPSLIVWGERDRSYGWSQIDLLWKTLPSTELAVMPGAAHAAHLEKPTLFHAILDDFLSTF